MFEKIIQKIFRIVDGYVDENSHNIKRELQKRALTQTAEFVEKNMAQTKSFVDKFSLLEYSIDLTNNEGLFIEFGVFEGDTINFISSITENTVYGFDSFEGLPEKWRDDFEKGKFRVEKVPKVKNNVKLVKGWFKDTLPPFVNSHSDNCAFIHIDCDLYSSTKTVFKYLNKKITKGTVIVFDEFFNYPGWKNGEYKAFVEFIESSNLKFEFIGYCCYNEQVAVKIL